MIGLLVEYKSNNWPSADYGVWNVHHGDLEGPERMKLYKFGYAGLCSYVMMRIIPLMRNILVKTNYTAWDAKPKAAM